MTSAALSEWREEVRELLQSRGSELTADHAESSDPHADLPLHDIKSAVKTFRSKQWQMSAGEALQFLDEVFPEGEHDEILFAILLLTVFKRELPAGTWAAVESWLDHLDHWIICDQLAINIAGRLVTEDKTRWKALQLWVLSRNQWWRRFAVTTACIVHNKGKCKLKDILRLIEPLMNDPVAHVQTVVAWAVRQVAGEDENLALSFLKKWKGRCEHEIFREATLRLTPQAKMALLRAKSHHT